MLLVFIVISLVAIHPVVSEGVAIRSVLTNSSASIAGIPQPKPNVQPVSREIITSINNVPINSIEDYYDYVSALSPNRTIQIKTTSDSYKLTTREDIETIELNETEQKTITEIIQRNVTINGTSQLINETITKTITVPKTKEISKGTEDLGLRIYDAPKTNIRKGLDLQGGTRVVLQPEVKLSQFDIGTLIDNMKQRLNVFGLSDIVVRDAGDLSGNQFIVVEIAGATEEELRDLLAKQGKFEAKVGNATVFKGGQDIIFVARSAQEAGIDPVAGCSQSGSQWFCRFRFSITLTQEAAQRQADATRNLEVIFDPDTGRSDYLSQPIELFLDDVKVDELNIGADLRGEAVTQIAISGSGSGPNQQQAIFNSLESMKRLQTILITGSLPVKLNIVKIDAISPVLGEEFVKNAILMSLVAITSVAIVVGIRYRKYTIALPILVTMISEVVILLGVAAIIGWNIDLAAIAGIIVAIGTGVDHQIIITDETLRGVTRNIYNWKEKIKRAFSIIMLAYLTVVVAMIPLIFAGAGLLKGFAITTIIGVTVGVFITRPAYSNFIEIMLK
ncbi:MAG: MMPL family transporter [Candidatus Woesearchaeota archaeon]|nr:MMPL family transporter [Candidatus Woesearchaeota archaeon]